MTTPVCARQPALRRRSAMRFLAVLALVACGGALAFEPAAAQYLAFPSSPPPAKKQDVLAQHGQKQMLVQANEIDYDYTNKRVSAVGNVQIYYGGSTIEADKVIYDQATKRLHAEGNVRLTDEDGKITYGQIMDLSDDYRNGFVDSLRLDTPDQTRMAAARAERTKGNFTVFHNGVYTACAPCKDDPTKPPLWQVKAARIIHDQKEHMIYFEDASIEFFGTPLAWLPYFSAPDPTVKRKTGFLMSSISSSSVYGAAVEVPYYWAMAPNYDATVAPKITTKQGLLMQGEFRQRLLDGAYQIRGSGINQLKPDAFTAGADRPWRGSLESNGQFAINTQWVWGWDAVLLSDKYYLNDYNPSLSSYRQNPDSLSVTSEGISQLYLTGVGKRSYFDARTIYYLGFSGADQQTHIPTIHPVVDYDYTVDHPVLGGEVSFKTNLTSLSRSQADFEAINSSTSCANTADPAVTPTNCVLRGIPGAYTRFSAESRWRRSITDSFGQVFTPFASVRADAASVQVNNDPSVSNFIQTGDSNLVRAMPTVGLEYRYPFISVQSWGTQTITPIAQVIARPNEQQINRWPNEDSQSFVFDASNLFRVDKFAGWDREEGGGRANYGLQYTAQVNKAGSFTALFGQSAQLYGLNSYAATGPGNTGLDSGLDKTWSDYVGSVSYQPNSVFTFSSRYRFDQATWEMKRLEIEGAMNFDRWNFSLLYGDYAAQPDIGFLDRRQGVLGSAQVKLTSDWVLFGGARYDINAGKFNQTNVGLGYIDDCLILALNYVTGYSYSGPTVTANNQIMLQLSLRTLGNTNVSQTVGGTGANGTQSGGGLF